MTNVILYVLVGIGLVVGLGIVLGLAADYAAFDRTSGGYEPPYDEYTGEPIDWDNETYTTQSGMVRAGYVLDTHVDCTSGMISFEILSGPTVEFRELSDRALAVHEPRLACQERGFEPEF